jgi:hypothetical protein
VFNWLAMTSAVCRAASAVPKHRQVARFAQTLCQQPGLPPAFLGQLGICPAAGDAFDMVFGLGVAHQDQWIAV